MDTLKFYLTCPKGLELLLEQELHDLGIEQTKMSLAGIYFQGQLADAYKVCLWSRLANKVLLQLHDFPAEDADQLYEGVRQINWLDHLNPESSLAIDFTGSNIAINNSHFGRQKTKDAIVDQIRAATDMRPNIDKEHPDLKINLHLKGDKAQLSLDLSGTSLHRRGYRLAAGQAPLKENLAAALLARSQWTEAQQYWPLLFDPMCGSGTLLIEAAMISTDKAPGLERIYYGFNGWLQHQPELWQKLYEEAQERWQKGLKSCKVKFVGYDQDAKVLAHARENAARAGIGSFIDFSQAKLEDLSARDFSSAKGLLVTNPPYGERLGETSKLMFLYRHLGDSLKRYAKGWQISVFSSNVDLCQAMKLRSKKQYKFYNGALDSQLFLYDIDADLEHASEADNLTNNSPVIAAELLDEQVQMFVNRLQKNKKKIDRWLKDKDINAYRLYDADIPEYQVAIDIYADKVHVQEYAPPKSVDKVKAFNRLHGLLKALPQALSVPEKSIICKQRKRQAGLNQYEKQGQKGQFITVKENGVQLLVNLHDYLDTGLFLDHRPVRKKIQTLAKGKDFLNLFSYTASASVHAAVGGAASTTSVDMSSTYLDWAKENLALNGFSGAQHRFLRADCVRWLYSQFKPEYDLIFMDPPTFSNSKKMKDVLDVQRNHQALIKAAMDLLRPGGLLLFSNNYRRFKLDYEGLAQYQIKDISSQSIDLDFQRNQRIHQCFDIRHCYKDV